MRSGTNYTRAQRVTSQLLTTR